MKKQLYIIAFIAIIFGGCEDFLDKRPVAQETTDSFLSDPGTAADNFEQMLHAAYSAFTLGENTWRNSKHYYWSFIDEMMSDDTQKGGNGASDMPELLDLKSWTALPSAASVYHYETPYIAGYLGAGRANLVLDLVERYKESLPPATYNRIKGEALFIRGMFYFKLTRFYGSIPYFDQPVTVGEYYDPPSVAPEELYRLIEKDLTEAVDLVPEKSEWGSIWTGGRATRGAVRAILARVISMEIGFGYNGKTWQDVYNVTKALINANEYELVPNYATIFTPEGEMNSESVFEIPTADLGGQYGSPGGTMAQIMTTLRKNASLTYDANLPSGWGFSVPSQDLYEEFESGDPRRECTIIANGDYFMGYPVPTVIDDDDPTGYWLRKYAGVNPRQNTQGNINMRIVRYSEVLLTHAEAAYHIGQEGEALTYLTAVRSRAQASTGPKGSVPGDPEGYPAPQGTLAGISATGGQALLDAIKHERRVELAVEGIRTWDLIRWGEYEDALRNTIIPDDRFLGSLDPEEVVSNYRSHLIDSKVPTLPIPSDEVENYGVKQNPGYN